MDWLLRIWGAVSASTLLAAAGAIISIWLVWVERKERTFAWKAACALALLGAFGIVFTIRESLVAQDAEGALRGELKTASDRADIAEGRIAAIEIERTGLLTQEQWNTIASQKAPSRLMVAVGCDSSPKSQELANQLFSALEAGDWGVWRLPDIEVRSTGVIIGWSRGGASSEKELLAKRLRELLESVRVKCEVMDSHATPLNAPVCLLIGRIE